MSEESYEEALVKAQDVQKRVVGSIPESLIVEEGRLPARMLRSSGRNIFSNLSRLYGFMERLYSYLSKEITCGKGCCHCCSLKEIAITELEILYIEKNTKIKRLIRPKGRHEVSYQPCPFLQNSECSIYPYRPYMCRQHFSMCSVKWCHPSACENYDFPRMSFTGVEEGFAILLHRSGKTKVRDIRSVFGEP